METDVLIIGAGLAGLAAGYSLNGRKEYRILEAEKTIGGLCRSLTVDGFRFDTAGHVLHFKTAEGKRLFGSLLKEELREHRRKAAIYLQDRFTDYPFQANTYGLPAETVKECLVGFFEALMRPSSKATNFHDWALANFGKGIAKHFMFPYNSKLWQHDLKDLALEWVDWSIPRPKLEEVINGALGIRNREFGYNPVFYYPARGGIAVIAEALAAPGRIETCRPVKSINMKRRAATLADGEVIRYQRLLSTMPLCSLLQKIEDLPAEMARLAGRLIYRSVLVINLAVDRPDALPYHWVYFPGSDKPFYRLGSASNYSSGTTPEGTSLLFAEISLKPGARAPEGRWIDNTIACLRETRILLPGDRLLFTNSLRLHHAYVVFNRARASALSAILPRLERAGISSFGRYGSWDYMSMEDTVLQAKRLAQKVAVDSHDR